MKYVVESVAIDCLMVRLFDDIDESNMPWIVAAHDRLEAALADHLIDLVPSYTTLMIHFDLTSLLPGAARVFVQEALANLEPAQALEGRRHVVPVWYDVKVGPELRLLESRTGKSMAEIVALHSGQDYRVFALGFAPGFAFMGLIAPALATPRLDSPRKRVVAGSVGVAERQTAVYPSESPGGWNILGRTPLKLFDPSIDGYSLFRPGDSVRFAPIGETEFRSLGGDTTPLEPVA
jgi:KipI family sensor histidine kinase inhibitor